MSAPDRIVDARGLLCPWPVLRLARAARELRGAGNLQVLADDPAAESEIGQLCDERGWAFERAEAGTYNVVIDQAVNSMFTSSS